jgi:putative spermidine/putrescine transport system substrate-binding protein
MSTHLMPGQLDRREVLGAISATLLSVAAIGTPRTAHANQTLTVSDSGGPFVQAFGEAYVKPFEREAGVRVAHVAHSAFPTALIKAMVETRSYDRDVLLAGVSVDQELAPVGMLEPIDWTGSDMADLMPAARRPTWMGNDVYATVLCYRKDRYGASGPRTWADFWDVGKFPGRRALAKRPIDTLEQALLADGVTPEKLYPLDLDRAFAKLDKIKRHIAVWWTGGAQTTQLLESGEVDLIPTWNARAQVLVDAGKPVHIEWNEGLYSVEGWCIPKGTPRADLARRFVKFCANPRRQAEFTKYLAYGPTNPKAYEFIPAERARHLPTAPENLKRMTLADAEWWGANKEKATERFEAWLLK